MSRAEVTITPLPRDQKIQRKNRQVRVALTSRPPSAAIVKPVKKPSTGLASIESAASATPSIAMPAARCHRAASRRPASPGSTRRLSRLTPDGVVLPDAAEFAVGGGEAGEVSECV